MQFKVPVWSRPASAAVPAQTNGYAQAQKGASAAPSAASGNHAAPQKREPTKPEQSQSPPQQRGQAQQTAQYQPPQNSQARQPQHQGNPASNAPAPQTQQTAQGNAPQTRPPAQQVHPRPVQRPQEAPRNNESQNRNDAAFVHRKIWTIGGRKKFIDFVDKLSLANVADFANIHGIGGEGHAWNSVIGITICDYSNGTGPNSITVNCCVDVEDVDQLYEAAKLARLGKLQPDSRMEIRWMDAVNRQIMDFQRFQKNPDGSRSVPAAALNALVNTISNAKKTLEPLVGAPYYTYSAEKNNPHAAKKRSDGLAPCYKLLITYSPFQKDGTPSGYPWYIRVETFDAPLSVQQNGASNHKSNQATNKKSAFINLSCDDFWRAMVAIKRYVRTWENTRTGPLFAEAERRLAAQREAREADNRNIA